MLFSIVLCLIGVALTYCGWRVMAHIEQPKVNRAFRSWFSEQLSKEDAQSYRTVNGVLLSLAILFFGVFLVGWGIVHLFSESR